MNKIIALCLGAALASCTSGSLKPAYEKAEVLERIPNRSDTPEWTSAGETMAIDGSNVVFYHTLTMNGNARPDACVQAAELAAKGEFLKHIQSNITASGQLNDVGVQDDPSYESLTAFLSSGKLVGAKTVDRYWEKRVESDAVTAERILKMQCSVKVAVKRSELERQMREATGNKGNAQVREALINAQKDFIANVGKGDQTKAADKPASPPAEAAQESEAH